MRNDWVPLSASALVVGAMALVFGVLLNPADAGSSTAQTLHVVSEQGARWMAMAVMYAFASLAMTLGLPAVLTLFERRGRRTGVVALSVFTLGTIGTCGYAMLVVFFHAMVVEGAVRNAAFDQVSQDKGLMVFLQGWILGFYGGVLLLAVALFLARSTPAWVPATLVVFLAMYVFGIVVDPLGRVLAAVQVMALAVAFTGIAMAAVSASPAAQREPAF